VRHKIVGWLLVIFVVFYIVKNPAGAAATAGGIGSHLADAGTAFGDFLTALVGGS
jgi:hypothetical protein